MAVQPAQGFAMEEKTEIRSFLICFAAKTKGESQNFMEELSTLRSSHISTGDFVCVMSILKKCLQTFIEARMAARFHSTVQRLM